MTKIYVKMSRMGRLKICVSDRCFFPGSAFKSSKKVVRLAQELGYEGVEFHPTWAVWIETLTKGRLSCEAKDIYSFHISWREDGQRYWQGSWFGKVTLPAYNLFPFEPFGTKVLQKLEIEYQKPVVIHWQEDFGNFQETYLELHAPLGMDLNRVMKALKQVKIQGVVIDTDKFRGWLEKNQLKEGAVLRELFPYIKEVHFRFGHREDLDLFSGKIKSKSARLMKKLVKMGYRGRVVVEMGWPDKSSVEILEREGFEKVHQGIINWLRKL
ncbi:hypothetical protein ACFL0Y_02285 [Patescibacteria group bacterium]